MVNTLEVVAYSILGAFCILVGYFIYLAVFKDLRNGKEEKDD